MSRPDEKLGVCESDHRSAGPGGLGGSDAGVAHAGHRGTIEDLSQLLIGEDPRRVEHLWQMMWRQHFWHGSGVTRSTAIAGIDLALWDILGKVHGVPCHQLWGGPVRDYIRLYCHLGGGNMESFYQTSTDNAAQFGELAQKAVADGFTAFKSMAVPPTMPIEGLKPIKAAEDCVAAMREAVGDDIDIMVDCHARPSPAMGLQFAKALDPYGLYFFEEPLLAGIDGESGADQCGGDNADCDGRTVDPSGGVSRSVCIAGL